MCCALRKFLSYFGQWQRCAYRCRPQPLWVSGPSGGFGPTAHIRHARAPQSSALPRRHWRRYPLREPHCCVELIAVSLWSETTPMRVQRQVRDLRALRDLIGYHLEDLDLVFAELKKRTGVHLVLEEPYFLQCSNAVVPNLWPRRYMDVCSLCRPDVPAGVHYDGPQRVAA